MLEISEKKTHEFYSSQIGKTRLVLFEHPKKGAPMHGFTDNYIRVEMPYEKNRVNTTCKILLGDFNETGDALTVTRIIE